MLKYWFLFVLFCSQIALAGLTPVRCAQVLDSAFQKSAEGLVEATAELKALDLRRNANALDSKIELNIRRAINLLDQSGIRWRYHENTRRILVIEADPKGSELNRIAADIQENMKGLRLEFDPRQWRKEQEIFYDEEKNRVVIDSEIMIANTMTPPLYHELRHAFNQILFYQGKFNIYAGYLELYSKKIKYNYLYDTGFSLDEMITYSEETGRMIKLWSENRDVLDDSDLNDIKFNVKMGRSLVRWVEIVSARTADTLSKLQNQPADWKLVEDQISSDGKLFPLSTYTLKSNKEVKIEIFDTLEKNLNHRYQKITQVIIRHGKFGTSFLFAEPKSRRNDAGWIQMALQRATDIHQSVSEMRIQWDQLTQAFKERNPDKSAKLIEKIQDLVKTEGFIQEPLDPEPIK